MKLYSFVTVRLNREEHNDVIITDETLTTSTGTFDVAYASMFEDEHQDWLTGDEDSLSLGIWLNINLYDLIFSFEGMIAEFTNEGEFKFHLEGHIDEVEFSGDFDTGLGHENIELDVFEKRNDDILGRHIHRQCIVQGL